MPVTRVQTDTPGEFPLQDDNTKHTEPRDGQRPSGLEEARKVIEEYAAELREMLRKLRRKMD